MDLGLAGTWYVYSFAYIENNTLQLRANIELHTSHVEVFPSPQHPLRTVTPMLMQSDWEDRKGRFPIHHLLDGMCLDTFRIVRRIEFVVFVLFCALSGGV